MSHYRRANTAGVTYFFTVVTYRRQPMLCDTPARKTVTAPLFFRIVWTTAQIARS